MGELIDLDTYREALVTKELDVLRSQLDAMGLSGDIMGQTFYAIPILEAIIPFDHTDVQNDD